MNTNIFEVFFIKSLPISNLLKTIESFFSTLPNNAQDIDFSVVSERNQREETLNYILSIRDKNKDVFIVADDIVFRSGWYESYEANYTKGEILGFPMLFPETTTIQDVGYDFIKIDNELTYRGLHKNVQLDNIQAPTCRKCDSICGCAMYIKKEVFEKVPMFSLDGNNRIGEMIFTNQANELGFRTCVLDSFLYHGGISTKQNKNVNLSSISWLYEKEKWDQNVKKYFRNVVPKDSFKQILSESLKEELANARKVLVYGCGTVADFIIKENILIDFDVCSGLEEEIEKNLRGKTIYDVNKIDLLQYDRIIISAIGYEKEIVFSYFSNLDNNKFCFLQIVEDNFCLVYEQMHAPNTGFPN